MKSNAEIQGRRLNFPSKVLQRRNDDPVQNTWETVDDEQKPMRTPTGFRTPKSGRLFKIGRKKLTINYVNSEHDEQSAQFTKDSSNFTLHNKTGGCSGNSTLRTPRSAKERLPEFSERIHGRGTFPLTPPAEYKAWPLAKWSGQLSLPFFNPRSKVEMETWFETVAFKVRAYGATGEIFIKVMQLNSTNQLREMLNTALVDRHQMEYLSDLADHIAWRLFRGNEEVDDLELQLLTQSPCSTVYDAFLRFRSLQDTYHYMVERRGNHSILGRTQEIRMAFSLIPERVATALKMERGVELRSGLEVFEAAKDMETILTRIKPNTRTVYQALEKPEDTKMVGKCFGCGGDHFRRNCPNRKDRCAHCGWIGHTSEMCRNKVIHDSAGVRKMVAAPKQTGVVTQMKMDNTTPAQIRTFAGVVDKLMGNQESSKEKARERYSKKKKEVNPDYKRKEAPERQVLFTEAEVENMELEEVETSDEEIPKAYQAEDPISEVQRSRKQKLLKVRLNLNGCWVNCCLDTGAQVNIISQRVANDIGLELDEDRLTTLIKDVHQGVQRAPMSRGIRVQAGSTSVDNVRFAVLNLNVETIASLELICKLGLIIDACNQTVSTHQEVLKCFIAQENKEHIQTTETAEEQSKIINQTKEEEPTKAIDKVKNTWSKRLTSAEVETTTKLLTTYSQVWLDPQVGRCTIIQMELKVEGIPKRFTARPIPPALRPELDKQIDGLLEAKAISYSPKALWVAPCHLVPKPRTEKWRLVIDYRYINERIQDDGYQMPHINDLLIGLSGSAIFSVIDLNWGFWNVSLAEESKGYTGFAVPGRGVFTWNVMPFGLKVSPTIFQRAIEMCLREILDEGNVVVYIDDIIIHTADVETHLQLLERVLAALDAGGFFINFEKMKLLQDKVLFLGHIISENRLEPDPAKIEALVKAAAPKTKKEVKSFCAAANYLRAFIPRFSEIIEPLTRLTRKRIRYSWSSEQEGPSKRSRPQ